MGDRKFEWYYGHGSQPDTYYTADSREEAIALGSEYGEDFTICEADKGLPSIPNASQFIDMYCDQNEELGGDGDMFGEDLNPTKEQEAELSAALAETFNAWLDKHRLRPRVWQFGTMRNEEYFPAKDENNAQT